MTGWGYPALSPNDGDMFTLFLATAVLFPAGVLVFRKFLCLCLPARARKNGTASPSYGTLPAVLLAMPFLAVVGSIVYIWAQKYWEQFSDDMHGKTCRNSPNTSLQALITKMPNGAKTAGTTYPSKESRLRKARPRMRR